jgi:hypothetical protein
MADVLTAGLVGALRVAVRAPHTADARTSRTEQAYLSRTRLGSETSATPRGVVLVHLACGLRARALLRSPHLSRQAPGACEPRHSLPPPSIRGRILARPVNSRPFTTTIMGLKSFLKGLDSRPTTPQIGSVPLPDLGASDDDASLKSKRPRTPSFFRKRILSPFRSGTPLKRAGSSSTTSSSNLSSLHVGDLSPLTVSEDRESERFFHIVPATPIPESPPPRHSTPKQVPRCETPKPTDSIPQHLVTNTTASSPVPSKPRSITRPDIPHGVHYSPPKPPLSARASTPAPPRSGYEPQRPLRRASTPAPRSPPAPEHQHHASPQPSAWHISR